MITTFLNIKTITIVIAILMQVIFWCLIVGDCSNISGDQLNIIGNQFVNLFFLIVLELT